MLYSKLFQADLGADKHVRLKAISQNRKHFFFKIKTPSAVQCYKCIWNFK